MTEIAFTKVKLPFGWMGSMAPYPLTFMGKTWNTSESLFQALRFEDEKIREMIRKEPNPMECEFRVKAIVKELIKKNELHKRVAEPLSEKDLENMEFCVRLKTDQHPRLMEQLLQTLKLSIYKDVTSSGRKKADLFWGAIKKEDGTWEGETALGKIWMKIREEKIQELKTHTLKEIGAKFGLTEDPYKKLKNALAEGMTVAELSFENMRWYVRDHYDWSKPVKCYKIID
jgi:predicted NAD-dependent protein-ADP-ribosyltransferase YbiA (DUF1768 family)